MNAILKRNPALDVIRIVALTSVITLHFFLNAGFYEMIIIGKRAFIMTTLRNALMICVPLFMVLSGYLMNKKELSKKHYWGLEKTISIYLIISLVTILYRIVVARESYSFKDAIFQILNFSAAPYSWYIEMYIGLYLLIPFLNILYKGLKNKRQKQILVLTLIILTSIPNVLNTYKEILPNWWENIYPLTYYFLGCFLKEFPLKIKKRSLVFLLLITILFFGLFNYVVSYNRMYFDGPWQAWGSLPIVIMTILVFSLIINLDLQKISESTQRRLTKISNLCLGAYLISFIFDHLFYNILNSNIEPIPLRLNYLPLMVTSVLISSLLASWGINTVYKLFKKLVIQIKHKIT